MPKKQSKKPSGGANIKAAGKSPVLLALTPEEKTLIRVAAAHEGLPMSTFLVRHGIAAAEAVIESRR